MQLTCVRITEPPTTSITDTDQLTDHNEKTEEIYHLDVPRKITGKEVKDQLHILTNVPNSSIRLFFRAVEVENGWPLYFVPSNECVLFIIANNSIHGSSSFLQLCGPKSFGSLPLMRRQTLINALQDAKEGFTSGLKPQLSMEGNGGTYFLHDRYKCRVACFKPRDEEPSAPNNPRGLTGMLGSEGLRTGILAGEAMAREIACFLTDHGGFSGVPPTALVEAAHPGFSYLDTSEPYPKVGSFQLFVQADDFASDLSPKLFPVHEVHKIALLDIRMMNADRNDANILVKRKKNPVSNKKCDCCLNSRRRPRFGSMESTDSWSEFHNLQSPRMHNTLSSPFFFETEDGKRSFPSDSFDSVEGESASATTCTCNKQELPKYVYELIPIDHGYCLPSKIEVAWYDWCWLDWAQTEEPFDEESRRWVASLDPDKDAEMLRHELNIREDCLRVMKINTILLKKSVAAGLLLREIASIIARNEIDVPSILERQVERATELARIMLRNTRVRGERISKFQYRSDPDLLAKEKAEQTLNESYHSNPNLLETSTHETQNVNKPTRSKSEILETAKVDNEESVALSYQSNMEIVETARSSNEEPIAQLYQSNMEIVETANDESLKNTFQFNRPTPDDIQVDYTAERLFDSRKANNNNLIIHDNHEENSSMNTTQILSVNNSIEEKDIQNALNAPFEESQDSKDEQSKFPKFALRRPQSIVTDSAEIEQFESKEHSSIRSTSINSVDSMNATPRTRERAPTLIRVASFDEGQVFPAYKEDRHKVVKINGKPVRVSDPKEMNHLVRNTSDQGKNVPKICMGKHNASKEDELFDHYFFAYFDRLVDDMIGSVLRHSTLDRRTSEQRRVDALREEKQIPPSSPSAKAYVSPRIKPSIVGIKSMDDILLENEPHKSPKKSSINTFRVLA